MINSTPFQLLKIKQKAYFMQMILELIFKENLIQQTLFLKLRKTFNIHYSIIFNI